MTQCSPDSDTIERVAAALAKQDEYDDWSGLTERSQRHYRDAANAVIAAISAPAQAAGLREALQEAIDVFDGMNDDEINEELLPRLRDALSRPQCSEGDK